MRELLRSRCRSMLCMPLALFGHLVEFAENDVRYVFGGAQSKIRL
jgi:hypothetical protein